MQQSEHETRIAYLLRFVGWSASEAARRFNRDESTVRAYMAGRLPTPAPYEEWLENLVIYIKHHPIPKVARKTRKSLDKSG